MLIISSLQNQILIFGGCKLFTRMSMKKKTIFLFFKDLASKLQKRFFLLAGLAAVCAIFDGFRIVIAFMLLPFLGVSVSQSGMFISKAVKKTFIILGVKYTFLSVAALVISVCVIQSALALVQAWYQGAYASYYTLCWRKNLFNVLSQANWKYFTDASRGELAGVISQETNGLASAVLRCLYFLSNALVALAYIGFSVCVSWPLTGLMIITGVILVTFNYFVMKPLMKHARSLSKGNARVMVVAMEFLNNIKAIKASSSGSTILAAVVKPLQDIFRSESAAQMFPNATRIIAELFVMLALVLAIGGSQFWTLPNSSGSFLLILMLFLRSYSKFTEALSAGQQLFVFLPSFSSVQEIYSKAERAAEKNSSLLTVNRSQLMASEIRFENVIVRHQFAAVVNQISLQLKPKTLVAFVGASGAGKTTLVDALLRLVDLDSGAIYLGDQDIRNFELNSWRTCFGYVNQNATLMSLDIADNIRIFRPEAAMSEIQRAAQLACADEFICHLPEGYASQVGEAGARLSGGQCQRIALARALINDPPILIFDEATSALDAESELHIMRSIQELRASKLVILIAHRLSTVRNADKIYVIDEGRIVEEGGFNELLSKEGRFSQLWNQQTLFLA